MKEYNKNPDYRKIITGHRWQCLRRFYIARHPLCERCRQAGRTTPAQEVHHVRPIESVTGLARMEALAYDETNLMSLCRECHQAEHAAALHRSDKVKNRERARQYASDFAKTFLD